jgi:hypothetical protein
MLPADNMFKITNDNYAYYKKIAEVVWRFQFKSIPSGFINENNLPLDVLSRWEQKNMPLAKSGLKAGLIDSLCLLNDAPEEYLEKLNNELLESGLPGLALLMTEITEVPAKVLQRGKIRSIQEWYVVKEMLDKIDSPLTATERLKLELLFFDFERQKHR